MNPLRSVGTRLGLALAIVVAAALALVDLIVVPSLERNLVHAKIAQLRDAAPAIAAQYESKSAVIDPQPVLQAASESASARISVFTRLDPQTLIPVADSNLASSSDLAQDPIAERSAARGVTVSGTVERRETRYAEVAPASLPTGARWVFDHPFYLILNLAIGGDWPGNPDSTTEFPRDMVVDWVRVSGPAAQGGGAAIR